MIEKSKYIIILTFLGRIVTEYYECEMTHTFREIPVNDPIEIRESVEHIDAPVFNRFLAENYLQFYSSIEDAAMASAYLSDRYRPLVLFSTL